jgi:hypothetical protein
MENGFGEARNIIVKLASSEMRPSWRRARLSNLGYRRLLCTTPALVCSLARDLGDTSQGHRTVDGGPEIRT